MNILNKFIPYEKLSKKEQKRLNQLKRTGWGSINPVTRTVPDKKKYTRKEKYRSDYTEQ